MADDLTGVYGSLYTNDDTPPRFLKGTCKLGIVYAPDGGSIGGYQARTRVLPDPSNLVPENFYIDQNENEVSPRLVAVKQASGGMMPSVNKDIGAPMCTFAVYGISEGEAHRSFDLIKGPPLTSDITPVEYAGEANAGGEDPGISAPIQNAETRFIPTGKPFIPSSSVIGGVSGATAHTTYNIWRIANQTDDETKDTVYVKDKGATVGVKNKRLIQQPSGGVMQLSVFAIGNEAVVERVYPISSDLTYDGANLYYPNVIAGVQFPSQPIKARGTDNCGFQLHITPAEMARSLNPNQNNQISGITIEWGDDLDGKGGGGASVSGIKAINYFALHLSTGKPQIEFFDPVAGSLVRKEIGGGDGILNAASETSVYVHFAGPNMLIGFTEDSSDWSCITGFEKGQDLTALYIPRISRDARVRMIARNINYSFTYGPMTFTSFCPEQIKTRTNATADKAKSRVNVRFTVPQKLENEVKAEFIEKQFQDHRCLSREMPDFEKTQYEPTYYGDWRRGEEGGEIAYSQTKSEFVGSTDIVVTGKVTWDTTIEGPMFVHIRNVNARDAILGPDKIDPLVVSLPWGDLTGHLEEFSVTIRYENDNRSLLVADATIKLANLAVDPLTDEMLARIRENILVVTLTAGYDTEGTFFQGIIDDVSVDYDGAGQTITLTCTDILTGVLDDTPCRAYLQFRTMRYGKIIHDLVCMSGLGDWYRQSNSALLARALDVRLGNQPTGSTLASSILTADPSKTPYSIIKSALGLVIDIKNTLPVLHWEPSTGLIKLEGRSDIPVDDLYFAGDNTGSPALLPNSYSSREHGVLSGGYSMNTSVKQLYAGVRLFGKSLGKTILFQRDFPGAHDATGLVQILTDLTQRIVGLGWVGWRKLLIHQKEQDQLPDQLALNLYGKNLVDNYLRKPYESITFEVYVNKPLNHTGRFHLVTFDGAGVSDEKSVYYYQKVEYRYIKEQNIMKARVTGEKFPSVIADPSPAVLPLSVADAGT